MKVSYTSDLHLEFAELELLNIDNADVLVIAGDIVMAQILHDWPTVTPPEGDIIWKPSSNQIKSLEFLKFFKTISQEFDNIIYVCGNHEGYRGTFPDYYTWLKEYFVLHDLNNIHLLQNESITIDDVTFIGGTLWTDLNKNNPLVKNYIANAMNDYRLIKNSRSNYRKLSPDDTCLEHYKTILFLEQESYKYRDQKVVLVTHHAMSEQSIVDKYKKDYPMNYGYFSDLESFFETRPQIKYHIHGHIHNEVLYKLHNTQVLANPRGYPGEEQFGNFTLKSFEV